jgi:farnesyl-diphosphate farnesyltransferase
MSPPNNSILRAVSRSFYLSIRILPLRLREPVALGYLLARSTDTIADTAIAPVETRRATLTELSKMIQEGGVQRAAIADLVIPFAALQTNLAEPKLLTSLPEVLAWLDRLDADDRADVRSVLKKITRGQLLDLERFQDVSEIRALESVADLDEYTYLVAGCVGEFWTRLCFRHVRGFADLNEEKMLVLGREYGMGLQLINVLRDAGNDLRVGRCYFPAQQLVAEGLKPVQILRKPEEFRPIYETWIDKAERNIRSGFEYSRATKNWRVRAATVLPALIGVRTLALLREAGPRALERTIKIPRREVQRMIFLLAISFASRKVISDLFHGTTAWAAVDSGA